MDIKEIALKVRATTPVSPDPDKYVEDLFTNFVAEIQRQNPQVGLATLGKAMLSMSFIEATMNNAEPIKLFAFPPTAEQIANETAEACARVYLDTYDLTDIAEAIRSGAWKEFKK